MSVPVSLTTTYNGAISLVETHLLTRLGTSDQQIASLTADAHMGALIVVVIHIFYRHRL